MQMRVRSLSSISGLRIRLCHDCGCVPMLLWLQHRLAAVAPIKPLAWEPPYAAGVAQKDKNKKRKCID